MNEIKKENEEKKKQGRKSEEGIIKIIFRKNIGGNKIAFSNHQLYNSFRLTVTIRCALEKLKIPFGDGGLFRLQRPFGESDQSVFLHAQCIFRFP